MTYDVAIVGGGPAGLALALSLTRHMRGVTVALLDRRPFSPPADARATAIGAGVRRALEALGVWETLAAEAEPVRGMKITDSGRGDIARPLFLTFDGDVAPGEPFAHMVPNQLLTRALLDALGRDAELIAPVEIVGWSPGRLALKDGREVAASLIVAADGAMSAIRTFADIGVIAHDYRQSGIVTTISHEYPHEGLAWEHFRPAGPFASLPLKGNRSSLVWTEETDAADRYKAMSLDAVAAEIESVMGSTLGTVTVDEKLQTFPLRLQLAREMAGPRLALIGDAAHVIHPVAGQGLNLGLADVAALAEVVIDAMRLGLDHGAPDVLARYRRWRRFDTALMAMVTDSMNRLFSNDVAPVRALRDLGLGLVDRAPMLKDTMIARAAGLSRGGPKLLSGMPI
jgi:2-octaprenyl-6-methoxyphenol hydroxylase